MEGVDDGPRPSAARRAGRRCARSRRPWPCACAGRPAAACAMIEPQLAHRRRVGASESSPLQSRQLAHNTPSSSATYSIDSSPSASVPATTIASWPRAAARARAGSTCRAAPPTFRRAIACTIPSAPRRSRLHPGSDARSTRPEREPHSAARGEPPKSAAPASRPARGAEPARQVGRARPAPHAATTARPDRRATTRTRARSAHANEAELEGHLVEGLLRNGAVVGRRKVVERLIGEALARVRQEARELRRRQDPHQPVPSERDGRGRSRPPM